MEAYERLERELAEWSGMPHVVACSSGTAALHLVLEALRLPLGSKVIVPDYTMVACARAVTLAGLTPVFVDCGDDLLMDPNTVNRAVSDAWDGDGNSVWKRGRRISAIMPVNVYGREYDVFGVRKATESFGIKVVEDLAECHGVKPSYNADAACWSFYKNKIVAGEEGGAVGFHDPEHAALARQLRSLGFTEAHDFDHVPRGHNYRMSNVHARLIADSLSEFVSPSPYLGRPNFTVADKRREIEAWYDAACPPEWRMPPRDAVWVYDLRIKGMTREVQGRVVRELNAAGIAARHGFKPMHEQEEYRSCRLVTATPDWSVASALASELFYLPVQPGVTTEVTCRRALPGVTTEVTCRRAFEVIGRALG